MATSKTLTPTNVTIQIPEFTDQPDQRVNSNCIDKEADAINALNTQIATLIPLSGYVIHGSWKSGQTLTVPSGGTYSSILFMGYLQGHAHVFLRLVKGNGTLSVQNLDGTAFTSGYHTFTLSGNDIVISSTAGGKSEGTFVVGAWT